MKNENLEQWLPCQSYCQMNGAAAAVLSFKNTTVVLNGPSWCSLVVERELMSYNRTLQHRLYCSRQTGFCDVNTGRLPGLKAGAA